MAIDHRRVEVEVNHIDDLLHEARIALKSKRASETYEEGITRCIHILEDAAERLDNLRFDMNED